MTAANPGWYPDPTGRHEHRFHNGSDWTADVSDGGTRYVDPLGISAPMADSGPTGSRTNRPARASMVLGIVAVAIAWLPFLVVLGLLAAVPAIVFGAIGLRRAADSGDGRSFAVTGLVTGVSAVFAAMIGIALTVIVLDAVDRYADPAAHETSIIRCGTDPSSGEAVLVGSITNLDDDPADFSVEVAFVRNGTDNAHRSGRVTLNDVPAGSTERFEFRRPVALDEFDCRVVGVDGPLPFGIPLD